MRVALQSEGSGWVLDNICSDYIKYTNHEIADHSPDIVWCLSIDKIQNIINYNCPKVVSVHHIDDNRLDRYRDKFTYINKYCDYCISPNDSTISVAKKYIKKPIIKIPYWILDSMTKNINPIIQNKIVIGSFIKDSWGMKPKMSKNPYLFLDILDRIKSKVEIEVLLSGISGRDFIRHELEKRNIKFKYYGFCEDISELYNNINWYFVTSSVEGGPQSILECAYRKINILSTNVGMAEDVLHQDCICKDIDDFVFKFDKRLNKIEYNYNIVKNNYMPDKIIQRIDDLFLELLNNKNEFI